MFQEGKTTENPTTTLTPTDNDDPIRNVNISLKPGEAKVVTNPGYRSPVRGEGDIRYNFTANKGYGIIASCDDDYRPSPNFERPCDTFTITFSDGKRRKQLCAFYWLTETYFTTNESKLSFQMNYTEGGSSIVRCVFRTTELPSKPDKIFKVPTDKAIDSQKRDSFSQQYYLIEGEKEKRFNLDCTFKDTENSYCVLSRVIVKVEGTEELFCLSRQYRRKNITKAEIHIYSDGNGWPEVYCNFTVGTASEADTPKTPMFGRKPRRDYIKREERHENWTLKAGETKEFGTKDLEKYAKNVLVLNITVPAPHKVYLFCHEYKPEIDGSLPCDTFSMVMKESGREPEYWCSRRHLESLGYLSNGPNLLLNVENFSRNNKVTCAVRSTQPPESEKEIILTKNSPVLNITLSEKKESYLIKRWTINTKSEKGKVKIGCVKDILKASYKNSEGKDFIKRQYYCYQRRIQVNSAIKCELDKPEDDTILFEFEGKKADLLIFSDKDGLSGYLCDVELQL